MKNKQILEDINYLDIHSHLHDKAFDIDRIKVIEKMKENKILTISIGTDLKTSQKAQKLSEKNFNIFFTAGLHPHDNLDEFEFAFQNQDAYFKNLENLAKNEKCLGIGECGLDYFYFENLQKEELENIKYKQKIIFEKHLELASNFDLPLMLHVRGEKKDNQKVYLEIIEIIKNFEIKTGKSLFGNFHFFTSSKEILKEILNLKNWTVSFPAVITITEEFDEMIKDLDLNKFHIETDSPYVVPKNKKKDYKRNEPNFVVDVFSKICEIKSFYEKEEKDKLKNSLKENFAKMFL